MSRRLAWVSLVLVVALAAALRIYQLGDLPAGFYCDEAGLGYNAYTIANYGTDENGNAFPLFFWSFGVSYKNPAFIYAAAPLVKLFGPTEFAVRLTSALFGIGTVIAMFFLGRALMNEWVGVAAAFFLAVMPWHLHFSRIAFELISFPFFFVIALTNFIRFTQGKKTLWVAMLFFGLCFYAYKVANLFVPLFVFGATLLYFPTFLRRWRESLVAGVVLAALVGPVVVFELQHRDQSTKYFSNTTHLRPDQPAKEQLERTGRYYSEFFSQQFLFKEGDPIVRHAVRGFGELFRFYLPFLIVGGLVAAVWRDRATKLILWWLVLYPVAASLMTEIPSASRSIIGTPVFALLSGLGFAAVIRMLGFIGYFKPLSITLQVAGVLAAGYMITPEMTRYLASYWQDYPRYSAPTYGGFQYGYRQAIQYMEQHRNEYDLLLMTAVEVNQPQVFPQFFRGVKPREDDGYLIINPAEYARYAAGQRILAALRPSDLDLFSDYDIKETIKAPGGQVEFIIADVRQRKRFLTNWLVLGLFADENGDGMSSDQIDVQHLSRDKYEGSFGEIFWRRTAPQFIVVDLNQFFSHLDPRNPGNPEHVCAYAAVTVKSPKAQQAFFEISGSDDYFRLWLNGRNLTPFPIRLGENHQLRPIDLREGDNVLLLKTCENVGGWSFKARITDEQGLDLPDVTTAPDLPEGEIVPASARVDAELQLAEGFSEIVAFKHRHEQHPDYRGTMQSWWAYVQDAESEVVWKTAPVKERRRTVFAFTGSTSNEKGEAELFLDGKYALTFDLDDERSVRTWRRGSYSLTFASKASVAGNSGVYLLDVPADAVTPGKPLEIRVIPARGQPEAWFGVKGYTDTIAFEHLTPENAIEALRTGWNPEQKGDAPAMPERKPAPPQKADVAADDAAPAGVEPAAAKPAAPPTNVVRKFVYKGSPGEKPSGNGVAEDGSFALELAKNPEVGPNGESVQLNHAEFSGDGGVWIPENGSLVVPGVGDLVRDRGTISFTVQPDWNGSDEGDHSFVSLRDPKFWENRLQVFKNGPYLRFLFTPDSGKESGVGTNITTWPAGTPRHVTATWGDGMTALYVDGELMGSQPYEGSFRLPSGVGLIVGGDHPGGIPGANATFSGFQLRPSVVEPK